MATGWQTFPIELKGGLISNMSALQQGINAVGSATILQNYEPNKEGGYTRVAGYEKFNTNTFGDSGNVLSCQPVSTTKVVASRKNSSGVTEYFYANTGSGSWTSLGSMALLGGKAQAMTYNINGAIKTIFTDGDNYPAIYNHSDTTLNKLDGSDYGSGVTTDIRGSSSAAFYKNHLLLANGTKVVFPAPYTDNDFASDGIAAGSFDVYDEITKLIVFRDQCIIFCRHKIFRLVGTSSADFTLIPITDNTGCIDGHSVQEVGGDIIYLGPDGVRLLSATERIGDFGLELPSDTIYTTFKEFLDATDSFTSVVLQQKAQYRLFGNIANQQDDIAKALCVTKFSAQGGASIAWSELVGFNAYIAGSFTQSTNELHVFANNDGYVYKMESGTSRDGSDITSIYESPYMPINDPQMRKTFYKVTAYIDPTGRFNTKQTIKYDFGSFNEVDVIQPGAETYNSLNAEVFYYGSAEAVYENATDENDRTVGTVKYGVALDRVFQKNISGSGKTISIRFEDKSSTSKPYTLDSLILEYKTNDRQ